jgi:hypothetical protein
VTLAPRSHPSVRAPQATTATTTAITTTYSPTHSALRCEHAQSAPRVRDLEADSGAVVIAVHVRRRWAVANRAEAAVALRRGVGVASSGVVAIAAEEAAKFEAPSPQGALRPHVVHDLTRSVECRCAVVVGFALRSAHGAADAG